MFAIGVKIFSILLAGIAISKSYVDFRARVESLQMFVFWILTWTMIVLVALFPSIVDLLMFGSGRTGIGTFLGMALVFLFFVVYRMYVKMERMEHKLTKTIQELALKENWTDRRPTS